jgi:hypothetical protein
MAAAQDGELGVDHLAIVTDELNAFAPSQGGEMATVRKTLQKVATQGRYAGLALMGCAQQLSKVDELLRDNCASRALGSSAEAELTSGVHGRLSGGFLERIATLPKGQMALWHTAYRQALVVRFPRPAWRMGKSRTKRAAIDLTGQLRDGVTLTGTPTVTPSPTGPTISAITVNVAAITIDGTEVAIGKAITCLIAGGGTAGTHTLAVVAATSDSESIGLNCTLVLE